MKGEPAGQRERENLMSGNSRKTEKDLPWCGKAHRYETIICFADDACVHGLYSRDGDPVSVCRARTQRPARLVDLLLVLRPFIVKAVSGTPIPLIGRYQETGVLHTHWVENAPLEHGSQRLSFDAGDQQPSRSVARPYNIIAPGWWIDGN